MRRALAALALISAALALPSAAAAITFGAPDAGRHPSVGALIADYDPANPGPRLLCSGTLIAPDVFLTAGHCTSLLEERGVSQVWVTFDDRYTTTSRLIEGTYVTHPAYGFSGRGGRSNPYDVAVVRLHEPVTWIAPARLPTAGLLDGLALRGQRFTTVGYGTVRDDKTAGPHSFQGGGERRSATQSFGALTGSWLHLSMNPSTGSGGTCYGDSGGPHFLGAGATETNVVVSLTVVGDSMCRATDVTYRLDTPSARQFLREFVTLP